MSELEQIQIRRAVHADRKRFVRWLKLTCESKDALWDRVDDLDFLINGSDEKNQQDLADERGISKQLMSYRLDSLRRKLPEITSDPQTGF